MIGREMHVVGVVDHKLCRWWGKTGRGVFCVRVKVCGRRDRGRSGGSGGVWGIGGCKGGIVRRVGSKEIGFECVGREGSFLIVMCER